MRITASQVIFRKTIFGLITNDLSLAIRSNGSEVSLPARLEAILYLKGRPMSVAEIAELTQEKTSSIEEAFISLMAGYAQRDTALEISEKNGNYSLQLQSGLGELVKNLLPLDLSVASLRTLATVALKKRVLQSELVELRGSGAYDHIKELIGKNFIERKRQRDGRSYWITLSEKFHRTFSVLPDAPSSETKKAA